MRIQVMVTNRDVVNVEFFPCKEGPILVDGKQLRAIQKGRAILITA
ncbi:MAG: hypothetical protein ACOYIK_07610 [Coriobacteriales bacterium]